MVGVGDMNRYYRLEKNTPVNVQPSTGPGSVDDFDEFFEGWGYYRQSSFNRALDFGETVENTSGTLTIWYDDAIFNQLQNDGVKSLKVVFDDNRKFTIAGYRLKDDEREMMVLNLNEQR